MADHGPRSEAAAGGGPPVRPLARNNPVAHSATKGGSVSVSTTPVPAGSRQRGRARTGQPDRRMPRRRPLGVDVLVLLGGLGLGAVIAQWLSTMPSLFGFGARGVPVTSGNVLLALGQIAGLVAAYLALMGVLLAARVPLLESTLGLDRLLRTHRQLGPWVVWLMIVHPPLVILAYASAAHSGVLAMAWTIVSTFQWVWLAVLGLALIMLAGLASWRRLRTRLRYETWWLLHLSMYVGVALAFWHQLTNGAAFIGRPVARTLWILAYVVVFGCVVVFRFGLPLARASRYKLRVRSVHREAPGVVSLVIEGTGLDRLPMAGGQFALWRFLAPGMWWQAHPYSLSGLVRDDRIRLTVKDSGDHSGGLRRIRPGTRVLMEGPYGAFTAAARNPDRRVLLIAGGVGITPIRTLIDDLPADAAPTLLYRARKDRDVVFRAELDPLLAARGGRAEYLIGDRRRQPVNAARLRSLVPDAADRDWYVCGPASLISTVLQAATVLRLPDDRIHVEAFDFHIEAADIEAAAGDATGGSAAGGRAA